MSEANRVDRRVFLGGSVAGTISGMVVAASGAGASRGSGGEPPKGGPAARSSVESQSDMPYGMIGKAKISRLMLGGNLVTGCMHCARPGLTSARCSGRTSPKRRSSRRFRLAEEHGINTVFESGAGVRPALQQGVRRPHADHPQHPSRVEPGRAETPGEIQAHVDGGRSGALRLGRGRRHAHEGRPDRRDRPGRSRSPRRPASRSASAAIRFPVPMACEKAKVPCDFYVKTFHSDDYPSATPKESRKDYIWLDGGKGWYDNMWCINPEETSRVHADASRSPGSPSRSWPPARSSRGRDSPTLSVTARTSSPWGCSTSRSGRTARSPNGPSAARRTDCVPGGRDALGFVFPFAGSIDSTRDRFHGTRIACARRCLVPRCLVDSVHRPAVGTAEAASGSEP